MSKVAIIVMTNSDSPEGRGRMIHALTAAKEAKEARHEVQILFEGLGVTWLKAFDLKDHPFTQNYEGVFEAVKENIYGACNFCTTGRFQVAKHVEALGISLLGEDGEHFSLGNMIGEGYQFITF